VTTFFVKQSFPHRPPPPLSFLSIPNLSFSKTCFSPLLRWIALFRQAFETGVAFLSLSFFSSRHDSSPTSARPPAHALCEVLVYEFAFQSLLLLLLAQSIAGGVPPAPPPPPFQNLIFSRSSQRQGILCLVGLLQLVTTTMDSDDSRYLLYDNLVARLPHSIPPLNILRPPGVRAASLFFESLALLFAVCDDISAPI